MYRLGGLLAALGAMGLTSSLLLLATPQIITAQTLPPRPTVAATATAVATATPAPSRTATPKSNGDEPIAPGRIAGTVIDDTTGAPAPGITVLVGDLGLVTDENGNYDYNQLTPGTYKLELALGPKQGVPAQSALTIVMPAGGTVIQHLRFRSPASTVLASPTPAATPTTTEMPATLPATGGIEPAGALALLALGALLIGGVLNRASRES